LSLGSIEHDDDEDEEDEEEDDEEDGDDETINGIQFGSCVGNDLFDKNISVEFVFHIHFSWSYHTSYFIDELHQHFTIPLYICPLLPQFT